MAQDPVGRSPKQQLLADLDAGYAGLTEVVRVLPALAPSTDGQWGPFEVLGHMIGWHRYSAGRMREIAAGGTGVRTPDEDAMNEQFVREVALMEGPELLEDLGASFQEMRTAVEAVPESEFRLGAPGQENSLAHFIASANGHEHYLEHLDQLKAAVR